jgi:MFS family permease
MSAARRNSFADLLRNRRYAALWLAQLVSGFGDWIALMALFSMVAFGRRGTPAQVSGILLAFVVPVALIGPLAGVFVDRSDLRRTMIASDLIRAALSAALVAASTLPQVYALVFALSAVSCFFIPAQTAAIPLLVGGEELLVANALNAQAVNLNRVLAPAAAGVLVASLGERACFVIDSLTFFASAALIAVTSFGRPAVRGLRSAVSIAKELLEGLSILGGRPTLVFLTLAMVLTVLAVGAFDALIAVYVRDVLQGPAAAFGVLVSLAGAGNLLGAWLVGRLGQRVRRTRLIALGILALGVGVLAFAAAGRLSVALGLALWLGITAAAVLVPAQTLLQEESPQAALGRVAASVGSVVTLAQLASVAGAGVVAGWIGIRSLYYLVAAALLGTGLLGLLGAPGGVMRVPATPDSGKSGTDHPPQLG